MTKKQKSFFSAADAMSVLSDFPRVHIGCVATDGKHRIISSGYNSTRTHPLQKKLNRERFEHDSHHMLHAEVSALIPLMKEDIDFNRVELYIHRRLINGKLAIARPCASCMALIKALGIKKIHYTIDNGYACEYIN